MVMVTIALVAQLTFSGVAGLEAWPRPDRGPGTPLQSFMFTQGSGEFEYRSLWVEGWMGFKRWTTDECVSELFCLFNLEGAVVWELHWGVRAGVQFDQCRMGARFGRRGVQWTTDNRLGWGPERVMPADPTRVRLGYHAELVPYADCQVGPVILRGWGPVLPFDGKPWRQGNTLPRANIVLEPGLQIDGALTVGLRLEWGHSQRGAFNEALLDELCGPGSTMGMCSVSPLTEAEARERLQRQPLVIDVGVYRWISDQVVIGVRAGSIAHPGWRGRVSRIAAVVGFAPGPFRKRDRSIGLYQ